VFQRRPPFPQPFSRFPRFSDLPRFGQIYGKAEKMKKVCFLKILKNTKFIFIKIKKNKKKIKKNKKK
jgi:hypothetical protein